MCASIERGDERLRTQGQGRGSTDAIGPSWYDVRKLAQDLERLYGRHVGILIGPCDCKNLWDSPSMLVRAYLAVGGPWSENTYWASSNFGGISGWSTVASATYDALGQLWNEAAKHGTFADL